RTLAPATTKRTPPPATTKRIPVPASTKRIPAPASTKRTPPPATTKRTPDPATKKWIASSARTNITPGAAMKKRTFTAATTKATPHMNQKEFDKMFDFMSRGFDLRTQTVFVFDRKGKHWKRPIFALEPSKNVYNDPLTKIKYALPSLVQDGPNINHTGSNTGKTKVHPYNNMSDLEPLLNDHVVASRPYPFAVQYGRTVHSPFVSYEVGVFFHVY